MEKVVLQSKELEDIEDYIDSYIKPDDYYQAKATPLKSAAVLKEEHRKELREKFQFKEFLSTMDKGFKLIANLLPAMIGIQSFAHIIQEFSIRKAHSVIQVTENQKLTVQDEWSISEQSMKQIYQLAKELHDGDKTLDADAVFTVLCYLNPKVPEYSLGKCTALYNSGNYADAIEIVQLTKILQPNKVAPFIYSALCNKRLNNLQGLEEDLKTLDENFARGEEEKQDWLIFLEQLKGK